MKENDLCQIITTRSFDLMVQQLPEYPEEFLEMFFHYMKWYEKKLGQKLEFTPKRIRECWKVYDFKDRLKSYGCKDYDEYHNKFGTEVLWYNYDEKTIIIEEYNLFPPLPLNNPFEKLFLFLNKIFGTKKHEDYNN